ncbi:hypothetical protein ASPFODRAFT_438909 [Aspergillus luchuensis CBS 106.47]|uniref:Uncharacterized protein n=1 Tax=Aspergillus luchuensis (strain CBS 106.47) TaxID=1137211 RepID=A0A1M3TW25_ASPLC|nr:hypothetical protein ASPFODRAFT_438909 [Aspergillus luchuensis CBS 106.47]
MFLVSLLISSAVLPATSSWEKRINSTFGHLQSMGLLCSVQSTPFCFFSLFSFLSCPIILFLIYPARGRGRDPWMEVYIGMAGW